MPPPVITLGLIAGFRPPAIPPAVITLGLIA
jgi:hypothetical protein